MTSRPQQRRTLPPAFALLLTVWLPVGCSASHPTIRVTSDPIGASVFVPRLGIHGATPYEFYGLLPTDRIVIAKVGYRDWTGRVENLPKGGRGSYKVQLRPVR